MMGQVRYMPAPFSMSCVSPGHDLWTSLRLPAGFGGRAGEKKQLHSQIHPHPSRRARNSPSLAVAARPLPLLKKAYPQVADKSGKRDAGLAGVRCALFSNQPEATVEFLRNLNRDFPHDPDVLYVSVHAYSDLSTRPAQELARSAPTPTQAHELKRRVARGRRQVGT